MRLYTVIATMSSNQYRALLQKQIDASGGCGGTGGLFTPAAQIGLSEYQRFRAAHPGLSRADLSAMWAAYKTGGSLGGELVGGALLGGFPGQKAVFDAINQQYATKSVRKDKKKAARATYDADHPGWRAERALYVRPAKRAPARSKRAADLYKQMRALSIANPGCAPFGLSAAERADYTRLRAVADQLGIPRSAVEIQQAAADAKRKAKAAARAEVAAISPDVMDAMLAEYLG